MRRKLEVIIAGIIGFVAFSMLFKLFVLDHLDVVNNLYFFKTNLFNFIVFAAIIFWVCLKIDVKSQIDKAVQSVTTTVENSEVAKTDSETKLSSIEESLAHVGEEIDEIVKKSEENANLVGEKILHEAELASSIIEDNTEKAIENSKIVLKNELLKRASLASIEVAKSHIINELNNNQDLHNKFIDESLEQIEGVELG